MAEKPLRIGFISTRLAGTDGVSLEAEKWDRVFNELGHSCFYFAGECDRDPERSHVVPEAHFNFPRVQNIHTDLFCGNNLRMPQTSEAIHDMRSHLKVALRHFVNEFELQMLKVENALAIPMHVPLGLALTELIAETNIPTIAHHHDFYWERQRFAVNGAEDYLQAAFPPAMSSICHVVINTYAAAELARRTGMRSSVIPNVMDFDDPPPEPVCSRKELRTAIGLAEDEVFLLQPTRVVPRKCIERSIELAHWLDRPAAVVVSHCAGDEGTQYQQYLRDYASAMNVRLIFAAEKFLQDADLVNGNSQHVEGKFSLADAYHHADLVTYPSRVEGFGNAFLEAIYYRRPLLMGSYDIFKVDIQPKGFRVVSIDAYLSRDAIAEVQELLDDPKRASEDAEHNYRLGRKHYSYSVLRDRVNILLEQYHNRRSFTPHLANLVNSNGLLPGNQDA